MNVKANNDYWQTVLKERVKIPGKKTPFHFTPVRPSIKADGNNAVLLCKTCIIETDAGQFLRCTRREIQCAVLVIQGQTYVSIAKELNISSRTIEMYCYSLYRKFGVRNKHQFIHTISADELSQCRQYKKLIQQQETQ